MPSFPSSSVETRASKLSTPCVGSYPTIAVSGYTRLIVSRASHAQDAGKRSFQILRSQAGAWEREGKIRTYSMQISRLRGFSSIELRLATCEGEKYSPVLPASSDQDGQFPDFPPSIPTFSLGSPNSRSCVGSGSIHDSR